MSNNDAQQLSNQKQSKSFQKIQSNQKQPFAYEIQNSESKRLSTAQKQKRTSLDNSESQKKQIIDENLQNKNNNHSQHISISSELSKDSGLTTNADIIKSESLQLTEPQTFNNTLTIQGLVQLESTRNEEKFVIESLQIPETIKEENQFIEAIEKKTNLLIGVGDQHTLMKSMSQNLLGQVQQEKHDQRRQNLKRKRAREQLLQVVESFIRDQTILTAYSTYVLVNFQNDIVIMQKQIMQCVITKSLREVIQEVLNEIYVANTTSKILEKVVQNQIVQISQESIQVLNNEQEDQKVNTLQNYSFSIFENLLQKQTQRQISSLLEDSFNDLNVDSCENQLMEEIISQLIQHQIEQDMEVKKQKEESKLLQIVLESIIDDVLIQQCLRQCKITIVMEKESQNEQSELLMSTIAEQYVEKEVFKQLSQVILAQISFVEQQKQLQLQQNQQIIEQLQAQIIENVIKQELIVMFNYQIKLEYFGQIQSQKIVDIIILEQIDQIQEEIVLKNSVADSFFEENLLELLMRNILESVLLKEQISDSMQNEIIEKQVSDREQLKEICLYNMIDEVFIPQVEGQMIYQANNEYLDEVLVYDEIFDEILIGIMHKDIIFQIQLLIDSRQIRKKVTDQVMIDLIQEIQMEVVIPIQIQESILDEQCNQFGKDIIEEKYIESDCVEDLLIENIYQLILETVVDVNRRESMYRNQGNTSTKNATKVQQQDKNESKEIKSIIDKNRNILGVFEQFLNGIQQDSLLSTEKDPSQISQHFQQINNKQIENLKQRGGNSKQSTEQDKMCRYYASSFLNRFLKKQIRGLVKETIMNNVAEQIYKKTLNKVMKRSLYHIIQSSVDTIYNLEEDTISLANHVLDGFILTHIDQMICTELIVTEDALNTSHLMMENVLSKEIRNICTLALKERGYFDKLKKKKQSQQTTTYNQLKHQNSYFSRDKQQYQQQQQKKSGLQKQNSNLINGQKQQQQMRSNQNILCQSNEYQDENQLEDEEEKEADVMSDGEQVGIQLVVLSPSKVPKFNRNLNEQQKQDSSNIQTYKQSQQQQYTQQKVLSVEQQKNKLLQNILNSDCSSVSTFKGGISNTKQKNITSVSKDYNETSTSHLIKKSIEAVKEFQIDFNQTNDNSQINQNQTRVWYEEKKNQSRQPQKIILQQDFFEDLQTDQAEDTGFGSVLSSLGNIHSRSFSMSQINNLNNIATDVSKVITQQDLSQLNYKEQREVLKKGNSNNGQQQQQQQYSNYRNTCSGNINNNVFQKVIFCDDEDDKLCTVLSDEEDAISSPRYSRKIDTVKQYQQTESHQILHRNQTNQTLLLTSKEGKLGMHSKQNQMRKSKDFTQYEYYKQKNSDIYSKQNSKQNYDSLKVLSPQNLSDDGQKMSSESSGKNKAHEMFNDKSLKLINKQTKEKKIDKKLKEEQLNKQIERVCLTLNQRYLDLKKTFKHNPQLQQIQQLQNLSQQILTCNSKIQRLFEIDQQLKDILTQVSSDPKQHQDCFSVILFTNQLALLNYQKVSCLVEKRGKTSTCSSKSGGASSVHSKISKKENEEKIGLSGIIKGQSQQTNTNQTRNNSQNILKKTNANGNTDDTCYLKLMKERKRKNKLSSENLKSSLDTKFLSKNMTQNSNFYDHN